MVWTSKNCPKPPVSSEELPRSYPESAEARRKERVAMAREICLHRGEDPNTIDRGGNEGWEKYEPLAGACIREAERLFARRTSAVAQASLDIPPERHRTDEQRRDIQRAWDIVGMVTDGHPLNSTEGHLAVLRGIQMGRQLSGVAETVQQPLAAAIAEYSRDIRRNSSGGDDYPWETMTGVADALDEILKRYPAQAPMKRQYFYRVTGCKAYNSTSPDCICWHDEGTGPYAREPEALNWRTVPSLPSTEPRCTCAAIVNPNIPHARSCPLSDHKS